MDAFRSTAITIAAVAVLAGATAFAQPKADPGRQEYLANCASCHGPQGRGDGPNKPYLTRSPSDLTLLAKANGGVLPVSRLYESIDGSRDVAGHGNREMPVWGDAYRLKAGEHFHGVAYDPEAYVRGKILALIDYLNRLQAR